MAVLREVKLNWASLQKPNTQFEPMWEVQAVFQDKKQADEFVAESKKICPKGKGVKIQEENGEFRYRFRRKVERADGKGENDAPLVCGPGGKDDIFTQLIGNGSIGNIQYTFNKYDNKFGKGVTVDLKGVQVLEHVQYGVQDGDEFDSYDSKEKEDTPSSNEYDDEDFA